MLKCKSELLLILIIELFCMTMLYSSLNVENVYLEPNALNPMTYPRVLLAIMVFLAPLLIFSGREQIDIKSLKAIIFDMLLLTAIMIGYWVLLPILGFALAAFILSFAGLLVLRYSGMVKIFVFSAGISIAFWVLFCKIMLMPMPSGIFSSL